MPSQSVVFVAAHRATQLPCSQTSRAVQDFSHAPQCTTSEETSTQAAAHSTVGAAQLPHCPSTQGKPPTQANPQPPQFSGSFAESTQVDPQRSRGDSHSFSWMGTDWQRLPEHHSPVAQLDPQAPQLLGSLRRSTQTPLHRSQLTCLHPESTSNATNAMKQQTLTTRTMPWLSFRNAPAVSARARDICAASRLVDFGLEARRGGERRGFL